MQLIPAIDIIAGQCVRLTKGDYAQKKVYDRNPVDVARQFEDIGFKRLHVVDLDGARAKQIVNHKVLAEIVKATNLQVDFGGGLKSTEDVRIAFESGAHQITGGTIAAKQPELFLSWLETYGPERIILGADARNGYVAVSGWEEQSELELFDFIEGYIQHGVKYVICTDIERDGALMGPSTQLYQDLRNRFPDLDLIASGGVSQMEDLYELQRAGCFGAIFGKAWYEERISKEEVHRYFSGQ